MSVLGKALIVAQLAFSILLMAFAAGVSSVQTNWKQKAVATGQSLQTTTAELNALQDKARAENIAHDARAKLLTDERDKAQGGERAARDKIQQLEKDLALARTELENTRAEAKIAGEEARARREESVALRSINNQLHTRRDELIAATRSQADKIVNLEQETRTMTEKHNRMLNDYAILQKFIRIKGFDSDPKEVAGLIEPPPPIQAMVLNTKKGGRSGSDLVEISVGSDAGLAKGHEMFVYRADGRGKYLGKIRLDYVDYRTAVGVVIESTKNGEIQRGDNVTTKL